MSFFAMTRARRKAVAVVIVLCWVLGGLCAAQQSTANAQPGSTKLLEQGKFRLHKFEQAIGEESYQISQDGSSLLVASDFKFTDRNTAVPLSATLKLASDLTPEEFEVKGKNSRLSAIDDAVLVAGDKIHVRQEKSERDETRPERFFTIAGYAPTAMQMMLLRYWQAHGRPDRLKTFPSGEVLIEHRGMDEVEADGKKQALDRYSISGLIWGRETVWLDSQQQLAAVVTVDAEFDHFEAVREGLETALPVLVARAGKDEMAALADIAKRFPGRHTGKLALVGGTLVDGTGRAPIEDAAVVIDGEHIVAAGPRSRVEIPKDAAIIDAKGKTILPGLWDMHAHFEQVEWGPIYLAAGATTVRDVGNELEFITAVRDAIRDGRGLGPHLLLAGVVDGTGPAALGVQRVDNPEQAQYWVNRYHQNGFQQMKLYSSLTEASVAAVAADAHKLGMTVTGHIPEGMTAYQGVEAGMDQINHIQYVAAMMVDPSKLPEHPTRRQRFEALASIDVNSPEARKAIAFLHDHHTVIDPTMGIMEELAVSSAHPFTSFEPGVNKVAPELAEQYATPPAPPTPQEEISFKVFQKYIEILGALHRAGITIVAGTDQGVPGFSLYRELELYVEAGFTPMEAIQAATLVPARVMGVDKEVGTVEPGKRADVIVLAANPLDSIHNIRTVQKVVTGGVLYDSAPLWESVGFKP